MILPKVSSIVGLGTTAGAMMFNTATSKFQGFTGAAWVDLHQLILINSKKKGGE